MPLDQPPKPVRVLFEVPPNVALALAQMVKRQGWSDWRTLSVDNDEAYLMRDGCEALRRALAEQGFSPR
jgi:hypothetical protein